jgi:3-hydroxymyristoyl/3-hydroxydecanoyl-(acyl carrier protein) dehydratase
MGGVRRVVWSLRYRCVVGRVIVVVFHQVEAIAQATGIMGLYKNYDKASGAPVDAKVLFMGVDNTRFRGMVRPGDVLRIEVKMLQFKRGIGKFAGKCYVEDKLVCEAEGMAMFEKD